MIKLAKNSIRFGARQIGKLVARVGKTDFSRNVLNIASGALLSQGILILSMPILTRLYGPADFGALSLYAGIAALIAGLFTLKYDLSILLPSSSSTAGALTKLTLLVSALFCATLLFALLIGMWAGDWPPQDQRYFLLLPLSAFLAAAHTCGQQWSARRGDYSSYATSQVVGALSNVGAAILLALFLPTAGGWALINSVVIGACVAVCITSWPVINAPSRSTRKLNFRRLWTLAIKFSDFPRYVLPASAIATIGVAAYPVAISAIFSMREVGLFAIASRFLVAPSSLLGSAIAEAARPALVELTNQNRPIAPFLRSLLLRNLVISLPIFLLCFVAAPALFSVLLGEQFREAGLLSQYMCLGAAGQFVSQPVWYVFPLTEQARLGLVMQTASTILPLLGLLVGGWLYDLTTGLLLAAIVTSMTASAAVLFGYKCCLVNDSNLTGN